MRGGDQIQTGPFADRLRDHGPAVALIAGDERLTYAELATRVDERAAALAGPRRLLLHRAAATVPAIVDHLAARRAGHVLLPVAPDADVDGIVAAYAPAIDWDDPTAGGGYDLHPALAMLLSTSGSTGSPKLVRLSHENLASNAEAIATYLGLRADDRAITALPLHYCYGLSVLHSHLAVGASVVLSDASVRDDEFWTAVRRHRVTNIAGVPYTFELLDQIGFDRMELPSLRFVTQAGGRLDPASVRRYARLGAARGWVFFVMYGQTEATARMAYLPPALAGERPTAIGRPIPGGSLTVEHEDGSVAADGETGELVYRGPNVMLGYARGPADLALGREVTALRTGDLARRDADGLFEVVGRRSRFTKIFGLRIDLDEVQRSVAHLAPNAVSTGDDRHVHLIVPAGTDLRAVRDVAAARAAIPRRCVLVVAGEVPRLANGKPDYAAVRELAGAAAGRSGDRDVRRSFADVLQIDEIRDEDTFVGLGGDSLSYVELAVRLERAIGELPADWYARPVGELAARRTEPGRRTSTSSVDTSVILRAVAIVLVVGTHVGLYRVQGGAHVLLAVAGYNFARFQLHGDDGTFRRGLRSVGRIAVPSAACITAFALIGSPYDLTNVFLVHSFVGEDAWTEQWRYWFVEALVQVLVVVTAVMCIGPLRRSERAHPFRFAAALVAVAVVLRVATSDATLHPIYRSHTVLWLFALGWAAQRATKHHHRLLLTAVAVATVPGTFGEWRRDAVVLGGLAVLVWVPRLDVPRVVARAAAPIATASLYIYLTHPRVFPPVLERSTPFAALVASLLVGVAVTAAVQRARAASPRAWRARPSVRPTPVGAARLAAAE